MTGNYIFRLDVSKHPPTAMEPHANWPACLGPLSQRREAPELNIWARSLPPWDQEVVSRSNTLQGTSARDEDAASTRGRYRLKVNLLLVEDVFVVEGGVFWVNAVDD